MSDQTYTTDLNVMSGSVHVELTDSEMAGWFRENVRLPLFAQMLALMDEHGAQQVLVAAGFASSVDLWRRDHPDRWATVMEGGAGIGQRAQQPAAAAEGDRGEGTMADERCYRRGDDPTDLSTDTRYVFGDDDVFHGPWCRADAHQPNCIHSAYLRPGDAPDDEPQYGGNVLADLAAAEAQVARLQAALTAALDDLEARDELSALDGLRAALAPGEPAVEPRTEE